MADLPFTLAAGAGLTLGAGLLALPPQRRQLTRRSTSRLVSRPRATSSRVRTTGFQVGAGLGLSRPAPGASEAEEIFEHLPEGAEDLFKAVEAADVQARQAGMAIKVVELALFAVRQDLVGFGNS